jgi:polysaccharide biosynthesis/export protein
MFSGPVRGWMVVILVSMSGLQTLGFAQTTLTTPVSDEQHLWTPKEGSVGSGGRLLSNTSVDPRVTLKSPTTGTVESDASRNRPSDSPEAIAAPEPAAPLSEFQEFVRSSVGRKLPIYGHSLFDHVPTTFAPVDRIPVTDDYMIGPGDEVLIRAWGQIDLDSRLVVDRGGEVFLPKVGALAVAGLKYQQLPEYLRTAIGRVFRNFDLTVNLGQLRSIQVFVVGQARRPGSYTVSSLSTLVNALFASGGPSPSGSMRHIQLKRNNAVITEFDLYDLLLKGDKSKDARLLPGDVIYIPPTGPSIAMAGSVNVPAIYELRDGTTLGRAIEMAGGLATTADGQQAMVERIENHGTRRVEEFSLDDQGWERALRDGDVVRIFSLSPHFENAVTLRGNVAHRGRVEWHRGMRLKDVLPNQEALVTSDYWSATNAGGKSDITRNAPEINWDYAVIQRLDPEDLTPRLLPFDLGKLVREGDEHNNLALEPGDSVIIFSQNDLAVPLEKKSTFLRLEGEFRTAGVFRAEPGETLRHLVERAGGFTPNAYLYGAEFTRESVRAEQQKGLDEMIEKLEKDISRSALASSGITPEEVADRRGKLEAQRQLVEKLRQVRATGRVVLDLKTYSSGVSELPEIGLEDGDRLLVPSHPSTVAILGAVYNNSSFLYRRGESVDGYLKRAGGPTRDADRDRMFLLRADGSVLSRQSVKGLWNGGFSSLRLMPGDTIVVPERLSHGSFLRGLRDWSQVFSQFALGAAAVRVIQ